GALQDLHSFPTRRSSDLNPSGSCRTIGNRCRPILTVFALPMFFPIAAAAQTLTPSATPCASIGVWAEQSPYPIAVSGHAVASQRSEEHTSELQSRRDLVC